MMWPENGDCPLCRQPAPIESLRRDHLIRSLVNHVAVRCPNRHIGCHWTGPEDSRRGHERECLARQLTEVQTNVLELERGHEQRDMRIAELTEELDKQMELNLVLSQEVETLKEQSEIDNAIIESLRSLAMSASRRGASSTLAKHASFVDIGVQTLASGSSDHMNVAVMQSRSDPPQSESLGSKLILSEITKQGMDDFQAAPASARKSYEGHTVHAGMALLLATKKGDISLVKEMLEILSTEEINIATTDKKETALHLAAQCGHEVIAEILLECPRFVAADALDCDYNTALHIAALEGRDSVVRLLLATERFRGVSMQNAQGQTALHCAAEQGNGDVAKMLLLNRRFTDEAVNAVAAEHMPWTSAGCEVTTERGCTALHVAARFGRVAVAKSVLEAKRFEEVNAVTLQRSGTALHVAAWYGHVGVARLLLREGGRFDAVNALAFNSDSALMFAAGCGSSDVAKVLLENHRFTSASQKSAREQGTALHNAAFQGHEEAARALLMSDGFPATAENITDRWGQTALHSAALAGHYNVVRLLLQSPRFESVNSEDLMGNSALHIAAGHGQVDSVKLLVSSPAFTKSDSANHQGQNALHLAAMKGHADVVRILGCKYARELVLGTWKRGSQRLVDGVGGFQTGVFPDLDSSVWLVMSFP